MSAGPTPPQAAGKMIVGFLAGPVRARLRLTSSVPLTEPATPVLERVCEVLRLADYLARVELHRCRCTCRPRALVRSGPRSNLGPPAFGRGLPPWPDPITIASNFVIGLWLRYRALRGWSNLCSNRFRGIIPERPDRSNVLHSAAKLRRPLYTSLNRERRTAFPLARAGCIGVVKWVVAALRLECWGRRGNHESDELHEWDDNQLIHVIHAIRGWSCPAYSFPPFSFP